MGCGASSTAAGETAGNGIIVSVAPGSSHCKAGIQEEAAAAQLAPSASDLDYDTESTGLTSASTVDENQSLEHDDASVPLTAIQGVVLTLKGRILTSPEAHLSYDGVDALQATIARLARDIGRMDDTGVEAAQAACLQTVGCLVAAGAFSAELRDRVVQSFLDADGLAQCLRLYELLGPTHARPEVFATKGWICVAALWGCLYLFDAGRTLARPENVAALSALRGDGGCGLESVLAGTRSSSADEKAYYYGWLGPHMILDPARVATESELLGRIVADAGAADSSQQSFFAVTTLLVLASQSSPAVRRALVARGAVTAVLRSMTTGFAQQSVFRQVAFVKALVAFRGDAAGVAGLEGDPVGDAFSRPEPRRCLFLLLGTGELWALKDSLEALQSAAETAAPAELRELCTASLALVASPKPGAQCAALELLTTILGRRRGLSPAVEAAAALTLLRVLLGPALAEAAARRRGGGGGGTTAAAAAAAGVGPGVMQGMSRSWLPFPNSGPPKPGGTTPDGSIHFDRFRRSISDPQTVGLGTHRPPTDAGDGGRPSPRDSGGDMPRPPSHDGAFLVVSPREAAALSTPPSAPGMLITPVPAGPGKPWAAAPEPAGGAVISARPSFGSDSILGGGGGTGTGFASVTAELAAMATTPLSELARSDALRPALLTACARLLAPWATPHPHGTVSAPFDGFGTPHEAEGASISVGGVRARHPGQSQSLSRTATLARGGAAVGSGRRDSDVDGRERSSREPRTPSSARRVSRAESVTESLTESLTEPGALAGPGVRSSGSLPYTRHDHGSATGQGGLLESLRGPLAVAAATEHAATATCAALCLYKIAGRPGCKPDMVSTGAVAALVEGLRDPEGCPLRAGLAAAALLRCATHGPARVAVLESWGLELVHALAERPEPETALAWIPATAASLLQLLQVRLGLQKTQLGSRAKSGAAPDAGTRSMSFQWTGGATSLDAIPGSPSVGKVTSSRLVMP